MKKLMVCLLAIFVLISFVGCNNSVADDSGINGNNGLKNEQLQESVNFSEGLVFKSNGDGTCAVSGVGTCTDIEVCIPSKSRQGDVVTSIGRDAFYKADFVKKVTIPDTVTEIGNSAFEFSNITEITIPKSVTFIDEHAFKNCNNLATVNILGGNNMVIGKGVFSRCYGLKNIKIPNGVGVIGEDCFYNSGVESIILPISLIKIEGNAFNSCTSLESMTYEGTVADWMAVDTGVHWNYGASAKEVICTDGIYSLVE